MQQIRESLKDVLDSLTEIKAAKVEPQTVLRGKL